MPIESISGVYSALGSGLINEERILLGWRDVEPWTAVAGAPGRALHGQLRGLLIEAFEHDAYAEKSSAYWKQLLELSMGGVAAVGCDPWTRRKVSPE